MSVKKNFLYNSAYQVLCIITPLVTSPYLSRILGAEQLGIFSFTYSIAGYFVLFAMLGVNNYGNRCVARIRDDRELLSREFCGIFAFQAASTLIVLGIYIAYIVLQPDYALISLLWIPYIVSAGFDINWFFFGLEEFKKTTIRNFIIKLLTVVMIFVIVRGENALTAYCVVMSLGSLFSSIALWPFLRKYVDFRRPKLSDVASHIKPNLILFVPVVANSLFVGFNKVALGILSPISQNGYFENAQKVAVLPFTFVTALGTVMLPRASNLFAKGRKEEIRCYLSRSIWLVSALSAAFAFGLAGISEVFSPVFFGEGYEPCALLISVLVIEMPFMAWGNVVRTQYLIPLGRDKEYLISVVIAAVVNVLVVINAIPMLGAFGAAIGGVASQIVVCVMQLFFVRKELPIFKWLKNCIPSYFIGLLMFVSVRTIGEVCGVSMRTLILQIVVGAGLFGILFVVWCSLTKNENYLSVVRPAVLNMLERITKH